MPGVSAELVNTLLAAFAESGGRSIVFPVATDGRRGHPVIWPRALIPELSALSGDAGGKAILEQHRDLWRPVAFEDVGAFADIDTREDLDRLRAHRSSDNAPQVIVERDVTQLDFRDDAGAGRFVAHHAEAG